MKKVFLSFTLFILGIIVSFALRAAMPSQSGLTWTSQNRTYFCGWNLICFWGMILLAAALSFFVILRKR